MNQKDLTQEIKEKVKEGTKPSDLKKTRNKVSYPTNDKEIVSKLSDPNYEVKNYYQIIQNYTGRIKELEQSLNNKTEKLSSELASTNINLGELINDNYHKLSKLLEVEEKEKSQLKKVDWKIWLILIINTITLLGNLFLSYQSLKTN